MNRGQQRTAYKRHNHTGGERWRIAKHSREKVVRKETKAKRAIGFVWG